MDVVKAGVIASVEGRRITLMDGTVIHLSPRAKRCNHPRCDGEIHYSTKMDPETGDYHEEGPCPER